MPRRDEADLIEYVRTRSSAAGPFQYDPEERPPRLARDEEGLYFDQRVRDLFKPFFQPAILAGYETRVAMAWLARALDEHMAEATRWRGADDWPRPLYGLLWHTAGMPLATLRQNMGCGIDPDTFLEDHERAGALERFGAGDEVFVRLTERGRRAVSEYARQAMERLTSPLDGLSEERVDTLRAFALRLAPDRDVPDRDVPDRPDERDVREVIGTSRLRRMETLRWLRAVAADLAPPDQRVEVPLRLHASPAGLPISEVIAGLGGGDRNPRLDPEIRSGMMTLAPDPAGREDLVRLTERAHQRVERWLENLARETAEPFEGIGPERIAVIRDGCWRIVLNTAVRVWLPGGAGADM